MEKGKRRKTTVVVPNLPVEIINEILSWLRVKSLLRFRCVSKEWHSLISDPEFITVHLNRSKERSPSLVIIPGEDVNSFFYRVVENHLSCHQRSNICLLTAKEKRLSSGFPGKVKIKYFGSSNGLLCFSLINRSNFLLSEEFPIYLLNPATRELKKLPHFSHPSYDPSYTNTHTRVGFGFDPTNRTNRDYKVVRIDSIRQTESSALGAVSVYSLNSGYWRIVEDVPLPDYYKKTMPVVNNALHWMSDSRNIYSFDLIHEVLRELPSLPEPESNKTSYYLDLFGMGETLSVFVFCYNSQIVELWMMKEYGIQESCTKQHIILDYQHWTDYPSLALGLWNDHEILFQLFYGKLKDGVLVLYNTRNKTVRNLGIYRLRGMSNAVILNESLVKMGVNE